MTHNQTWQPNTGFMPSTRPVVNPAQQIYSSEERREEKVKTGCFEKLGPATGAVIKEVGLSLIYFCLAEVKSVNIVFIVVTM